MTVTDRAAALELARRLPALNVNAYVEPDALLLASALLAAEAERERLAVIVELADSLHRVRGYELGNPHILNVSDPGGITLTWAFPSWTPGCGRPAPGWGSLR